MAVPHNKRRPTSENTHTMNYLQFLGGAGEGVIGLDENFHPTSQMRCKLTPNVIIECP